MVVNTSSIGSPEAIQHELERARKDLLDLGLRNSLISYRLLKARGAEVIDELPSEVFRALVRDSKRMSFDPLPEGVSEDTVELPQPKDVLLDGPAARHLDLRLQTPYTSSQLQARLLKTYYEARTFIEEQGVNVLFLALGMLEWYEAPSSQEPRRAPLVLVPVELERANALDRFHLLYTGEEIGENLSIAAKVSAEFGVTLPSMTEIEELDLDTYFRQIEEAIAYQPRWRVDRGAIALGFFSFGKFLMYRDLDSTVWPEEIQPAKHSIITALLSDGFREPASEIGDDAFIDPFLTAEDVHQVVDADSSQTITILDALHGRNLVVQGPPGTGKSQTITNIVAEAIGAGKTILFVAEKMAALEVVKRRLDQVGLGDACLELHSHKINKRSVVQELQRTLLLGKPRADRLAGELSMLDEHRARLNAYADAINTPVGASGQSPYEIYGELVQIKRVPGESEWPRITIDDIAEWSDAEFNRRRAIVRELEARVGATGLPSEHPFWGIGKSLLLPTEEPRLRTTLRETFDYLNALGQLAANAAATLGLPTPSTLDAIAQQIALFERASEAPDAPGLEVASDAWSLERDRIETMIESGERWTEIRERHDVTLKPEAWDRDMQTLRDTLVAFRSRWWRVLSGTYRSARSELAGYCQAEAPDSIDEQIDLVDDVIEADRLSEVVGQHRHLGAGLLGPYWNGTSTDWDRVREWTGWLGELHTDIKTGKLPAGVAAYLQSKPDQSEPARMSLTLAGALNAYRESLSSLQAQTEFDAARRFGAGETLEGQSLAVQYGFIKSWIERFGDITQMTALNVSAGICAAEAMQPVFDLATKWPGAGEHLTSMFERARYEALLENALRERSALAQFDGESHRQVVKRFRELDVLTFEHNRARLALAHWNRVPRHEGGGQLAVLRREFEKKTRHLPVRRLVERSGNAIQAIKPIFMMSPLSIATYIPPGSVTFDMVIFDEASQVKPVEAFGALLRGSQAIVVGDSKQLPPTSFFDALTQSDEDEEENVTADIESILGLFAASNAPQRMLRWHYRSRHESLITVSNYEFYDNRLVLFPSPDASKEDVGLVLHHLKDTAYDRGKTRTNPEEAAAVAQAVMEHARRSPELTLGVAAFSKAQTDAIIDQVEIARRRDPTVEAFFSAHPFEPFFVKNLENVQGDERDVIFISVGYGRTAEGYLAMSFGPLNNNGGERRLNVLITRSRRRCEVFTNLTSDDIDLNRTSARGVIAFKRFLKYAETGILDIPEETGGDFDSPFEEVVYDAITSLGYEVHKQVGSAGFFIDLAVVDPRKPGRYLLAVECDGATYHSARSARDRDRLRQQVLENLGWRIHRIWSTDWFRSPDREIQRVAAVIEDALAREEVEPLPVQSAGETNIERESDAPTAPPISSNAYQIAAPAVSTNGVDLHLVPASTMAGWAGYVVAIESPVHRTEVARRITSAAGVGRTGNRIRDAINKAIQRAARSGEIVVAGDFLWVPGMVEPPVRDRSGLPNSSRSIDLIAPEEVDQAILQVVRNAFGIDLPDVAQSVCRLFGFQRATEGIAAVIHARTERLVATGVLTSQGAHLTVTDG